MATGIPTFKVDIAEGMIDVDTSADRLFAYCIEADRGPVNIPTYVASNNEAKRIFGKENADFAPHFYQNPTGLIINRVGFEGMEKGYCEYKGKVDGEEKVLLTIKARYEGPCKHKVKIKKSLVGKGLNLTVDIDEVTSKQYQNIKTLKLVADKINNNFSDFLVAELSKDYDETEFLNSNFLDEDTGELKNGSNGKMLNALGEVAESETDVDDEDKGLDGKSTAWQVPASEDTETSTTGDSTTETSTTGDSTTETSTTGDSTTETSTTGDSTTETSTTGDSTTETSTTGDSTTEDSTSIDVANAEPNPKQTRIVAYRNAFEKTSYVDVIGVAALSEESVVREMLLEHIYHMIDPEVHSFRFGVTSILDSDFSDSNSRSSSEITSVAQQINSEWIICIGQGVKFQEETANEPRELKPYQCVQLYTGLRSSLGYSEAIFGGEQKKVLRGVVDTIPVINDGTTVTKDEIVSLNEAGICTFKKEYNEITFLDGVTTLQVDGKGSDVMTYENLMSIIAYVTKRLVVIAKPYQGQRLTEDLKSTLQTALSAELKTITETDGTLMALEEFNIPPYDVQVYSAGKTRFDDAKRLIRESKIIIQCRIVPVGALRDIDLHVIAI